MFLVFSVGDGDDWREGENRNKIFALKELS